MKKIIEGYKRYKLLSNLGIITTSLFLAISINFLVFDNSNFGKNITASVIDSKNEEIISDIYLKQNGNTIELLSNKAMKNAIDISLSITYDPEGLEIKNINGLGNDITQISNDPGFSSLIINYSNGVNIEKNKVLVSFEINKIKDSSQNINLINANFTDSNKDNYSLTTSGIIY